MRGRRGWAARWLLVLLGLVGLTGALAEEPLILAPLPLPDALPDSPGLALRRAVRALDAGDDARAERWIAEIARRHTIVADYADLLRTRLLVESERFEEAVAHVEAAPHTDSPTRVERLELLGRAQHALGRESVARDAWEKAARSSRSRSRQSQLHVRIAESFVRSGKLDRAAESYRRVWVRYAELDAAEEAERALERLEQELGTSYRDAVHTFDRGEVLYERRRNEPALAAYDQALVLGLPAATRRRAEAARAATLFRLRRYPEAALAYGSLPTTEERRIQEARAHARSGQVGRGARDLEEMGKGSRTASGIRASLIAALLWDGEGAWDRAKPIYRRVIARSPSSGAAASARWRLGWEAYRGERYDEAIEQFAKLAKAERDPIAALRPRYWTLRAREAQGDEGAAAGFAALATEYPLTYYGWRSASRTGDVPADATRVPDAVASGTRALRGREVERVRILIEAGLHDAARDEIARLDRKARGLDDRLTLAQLHAELGAFNRAQRLVVDGYGLGLSRGPVPGQLELWWHAWPAPFEREVREIREAGVELDTALLYSIMREESGYRPEVVSVSGARGLLQLMPTTAERVAREVHLEAFSVDDLFLPGVNIHLGSAYLEGLLRQFDGRQSAAIGSYNAGPHVVSRWVDRHVGEDDEFVEEIPYSQTRAYVKRVMRSLHAYRVLY